MPGPTPGIIPSLQVGGRLFTNLSGLIVLCGGPATASRWSSLRKPNGTAAYQVTTGKTLRIEALVLFSATAGGISTYNLGYGDNDVGLDNAGAPTNVVYSGGGATVYTGIVGRAASGAPEQNPQVFHPFFDVVAGKYVAILADKAVSSVWAYGYER